MRIGLLCHSYPPHHGGVEIIVRNLARGLAGAHEVLVVSSASEGRRGRSVEDGFEVHRLPALHASERFGVPYPLPLGPGLREASAALAKADVLHAHGALYPTTLLAMRLRKPLVLTEHVGFVEYRSRAVNAVERMAWAAIGDRTVRAARAVTAYNTRVQRWLEQRFSGLSVRFVGNGVATESFRPRTAGERRLLRRQFGLPEDALLVLCAGRASEKKNLDAVLAIPRRNFHLVLCGFRGGLTGENLTDLDFLPHERMPDLFGCMDMALHAAHGEGVPLAVQEALSCGLPLALFWDDGYAGSLAKETVLACDSLEELQRRTPELAASAERRAALSARARAWAEERWSWKATVGAYEALYREVLA